MPPRLAQEATANGVINGDNNYSNNANTISITQIVLSEHHQRNWRANQLITGLLQLK